MQGSPVARRGSLCAYWRMSSSPGGALDEATVVTEERAGDGAPVDKGRGPVTCGLTIAFGVVYLLYSLLWMPVVHGIHAWIVPADMWMTTAAAHYVDWGAFPYLYTATSGYFALPLPALLVAPLTAIGDAAHLQQGYPFPLPHPTMWLLLEPVFVVAGGLLLHSARRFLWAMGVRQGLGLAQVGLVLSVVMPCTLWGHFEDMLALAGVLAAATAATQSRLARAAVMLGLAIGCKQWALLAVPFFIVHAPAPARWRMIGYAATIPVGLAALPVALDPSHALRALLTEPTPPALPLWHIGLVDRLGTGAARVARLTALATAPVLAAVSRRRPVSGVVAMMGTALLLRAVLEPILFAYYLAPGLAVLFMAWSIKQSRVRVADTLLMIAPMLWALPY